MLMTAPGAPHGTLHLFMHAHSSMGWPAGSSKALTCSAHNLCEYLLTDLTKNAVCRAPDTSAAHGCLVSRFTCAQHHNPQAVGAASTHSLALALLDDASLQPKLRCGNELHRLVHSKLYQGDCMTWCSTQPPVLTDTIFGDVCFTWTPGTTVARLLVDIHQKQSSKVDNQALKTPAARRESLLRLMCKWQHQHCQCSHSCTTMETSGFPQYANIANARQTDGSAVVAAPTIHP